MPDQTLKDQGYILDLFQENRLDLWIENFFLDRKTRGLSNGTIQFYSKQLKRFIVFCEGQSIKTIEQITANEVRRYLLWMEERGHNPGGRHAGYRVLKTFLRWWQIETEPERWKNPFRIVAAPKVNLTPLKPIPIEDVKSMLQKCDNSLLGKRDKAILLTLLDTGVRAKELVHIDLADLRPQLNEATLRVTKNGKPRSIFFSPKTRKAIRQYLIRREDNSPALWISRENTRISISGLRQILRRKSHQAKIQEWGAHSFRRAFALQALRNGIDIFSLQLLMGHADLQVLRRYLAQSNEDLHKAHNAFGPVDNL
jgi:integrase/recombinase XerC/integrase/recombinase XerD